uniref:Uncharacterized protein n=1 Tax=Neospora caninum (strain Liverpool) TaxID=572307 RepID=A0A0F7UCE2_NEOCL|nr:TPA: hypothetical protein BN1204_033085 [Neospora caninum Liverpool]
MGPGLPLQHVINFLLPGESLHKLQQLECDNHRETHTAQPAKDAIGADRVRPVSWRETWTDEIIETLALPTFLSQVFDLFINIDNITTRQAPETLAVNDLVWLLLTHGELLGPACDAANDIRKVLRRTTKTMDQASPTTAFSGKRLAILQLHRKQHPLHTTRFHASVQGTFPETDI